jgi:hypothetical protein
MKDDVKTNLPLIVSTALAIVVVFLFAAWAYWQGLNLSIDPGKVMSAISPLLLTAAFIERAVEVVLSPWRDGDAAKLENIVNSLKAQTSAANESEIAKADEAFQDYKSTTQKYAFGISLSFSLAASFVGIRALRPFLDLIAFGKLTSNQQWAFVVVDMVLSAALLAGGADGIHSAVNAFTTFFNTTAQKAQQSTQPQKQ